MEDEFDLYEDFITQKCASNEEESVTKAEADRFGMADMEVTVGFWRKPCHHIATVLTGGNVSLNDIANKVMWITCFVIDRSIIVVVNTH